MLQKAQRHARPQGQPALVAGETDLAGWYPTTRGMLRANIESGSAHRWVPSRLTLILGEAATSETVVSGYHVSRLRL
jgi:hypothetical protein